MTAASRNRRTVLACSAAVLAMTGLSFAAVPLYNLFCKVTGFAGTPMVGTAATGKTSERIVSVAFDANVAPALGWRFEAEDRDQGAGRRDADGVLQDHQHVLAADDRDRDL